MRGGIFAQNNFHIQSHVRRDAFDITCEINTSGYKFSFGGVAHRTGEALPRGELDSKEGQNSRINLQLLYTFHFSNFAPLGCDNSYHFVNIYRI